MGLRLLKIAAWTVFAGDALVMLVLLGAGLASTDRGDPSMLFALLAAVPLGGLFALVFFGAGATVASGCGSGWCSVRCHCFL